MTYRLTAQAIADLDEIHDFIARRLQNIAGAQVVEDYLFEAFEKIADDPHRCGGRLRPLITSKPVKFLTVRKYVVIYDDRTEPVIILAVAGARQDLARLLDEDPRYREG